MKLLCISRKHPPSVGGMQTMNYELIRRLARRADAIVIAWGGSQALLPFFLCAAFIRTLSLLPARRRPDAIYLGDALLAPFGLLLKKMLRRPVAVTAHGRDLTFRFPLYRNAIAFALRRLDRVIGVSRTTTDLCRQMGVREESCATINNGADPGDHPVSPREVEFAVRWLRELGVGPERPILITLGRLVKRKGVAEFIATTLPLILGSRPRILYLVAGEGRERSAIRSEIARGGFEDCVMLAGHIPSRLLRGLMAVSSVFIMPNIPVRGDVEGFGIAALEAGCAGLPVVASDLEGIRDAVTNGENGFLVPPRDAARFAAAVESLLADEAGRKAAGARAREFNRAHFGWDDIAGRYLGELENIANNYTLITDRHRSSHR